FSNLKRSISACASLAPSPSLLAPPPTSHADTPIQSGPKFGPYPASSTPTTSVMGGIVTERHTSSKGIDHFERVDLPRRPDVLGVERGHPSVDAGAEQHAVPGRPRCSCQSRSYNS